MEGLVFWVEAEARVTLKPVPVDSLVLVQIEIFGVFLDFFLKIAKSRKLNYQDCVVEEYKTILSFTTSDL